MIAKSSHDFGVVLEDDVHLAPDFVDFLRAFPGDRNEMALHKIETFRANITMGRNVVYRVRARVARILLSNHGGAGAYVMSRVLASELLRHTEKFRYAADTELFEAERRCFGAFTTYQYALRSGLFAE